jgi:hypothetical protein
MSGTKRTPLHRQQATRITVEAIGIFKRWRALESECSCIPLPPLPDDGLRTKHQNEMRAQLQYYEECSACRERNDLFWKLHDELKMRPWEICVAAPDERCCFLHGTAGYESWPEAQARWQALEEASRSEPSEDAKQP